MDLKRNLRSRTFALTMIIGGLIALAAGLIVGLLGGAGSVWALILILAGLADIAVGALAIGRQLRFEHQGATPRHGGAGPTKQNTAGAENA